MEQQLSSWRDDIFPKPVTSALASGVITALAASSGLRAAVWVGGEVTRFLCGMKMLAPRDIKVVRSSSHSW